MSKCPISFAEAMCHNCHDSGENQCEPRPFQVLSFWSPGDLRSGSPLWEGADLQLRLSSHSYRSAALFLNEKGLWVKMRRPGAFFTFS